MSYTTKFRKEVMKFIDKGNTITATASQFSIGETTIKEWKKLRNTTGSLEKRPLNRTFKKIDPEKLIAYLEKIRTCTNMKSRNISNASKVRCLWHFASSE